MLSEEPTENINGSISATEWKFIINFSKSKTKFFLSFDYNGENNIFFVNGKKSKFQAINKKFYFLSQFCFQSVFNKFDYVESKEVSLKGNVYDFSVHYDVIVESYILNIFKYLTVKNNVKLIIIHLQLS